MPYVLEDAEQSTVIAPDVHDLVVRVDARGVILNVSETCRRLGYEPQELVGCSGAEFVHPADLAKFAANRQRLLGGAPLTGRQ